MSWTIIALAGLFCLVLPFVYRSAILWLRQRFTMRRVEWGEGASKWADYTPLDQASLGRFGRWLQESKTLKILDIMQEGSQSALQQILVNPLKEVPEGVGCLGLILLIFLPPLYLLVAILFFLLFPPALFLFFPLGLLWELFQRKK